MGGWGEDLGEGEWEVADGGGVGRDVWGGGGGDWVLRGGWVGDRG